MHEWLLAHRGDDDMQLELRALFGLPETLVGVIEVYTVQRPSLSQTVQAVQQIASLLAGATSATVALVDAATEGVIAATALCAAALDGEFVFSREARRRLEGHLGFVRARRRPGWRFPLSCATLAPPPFIREECRRDAATLDGDASFVGRNDERDELLRMMRNGDPPFAVIRAEPGFGASRLVREAARVTGARLHRCLVGRSGPEEVQMTRIITDLCMLEGNAPRWLVLDVSPHTSTVDFTPNTLASRAPGVGIAIVASRACTIPWCSPEREVELGPLAPTEARDVVRSMLGLGTADPLVTALARRGGAAVRALVTEVRTIAASGRIVRVPGPPPSWRLRARRLLHPRPLVGVSMPLVAALDALSRRAWELCIAVGDGADVYALRGVLRAVLGAPDLLSTLVAHGLVTIMGTTVDLGRSTDKSVHDPNLYGRVAALQTSGALDVLAEAERSLEVRAAESAARFARAARACLAVGDLGAAVRLASVARSLPRPTGDTTVEDALRAVAAQLGPLQGMTPRPQRPVLTPEALASAAATRLASGDTAGAQRLRALAALLEGDLQPALAVGRAPASVRDLVMVSLAHARAGHLLEAARTAVAALSRARREADRHGEQASLALLASIFEAAGRTDAVARFTAAMRDREAT